MDKKELVKSIEAALEDALKEISFIRVASHIFKARRLLNQLQMLFLEELKGAPL